MVARFDGPHDGDRFDSGVLQGYWPQYRSGFSRDFYVIADALTIRSDLCQPARRRDAFRRKRLMDLAVVSVNGVTTDVPNALRALPIADYVFLSKEVAKLVEGDFTKAETPSI